MTTTYIKKYWAETDTWYWFHFVDGWVERQIEVWPTGASLNSRAGKHGGGDDIADQPLSELEFEAEETITQAEFKDEWSRHQ